MWECPCRVIEVPLQVVEYLQKLEKDKAIDRLLYYWLYPEEAIPCIYGLLKIHKEGAPLRSIIGIINSVAYNISKHWASILAPLVGNGEHHIKNSKDSANKVREITLDSDETMVSDDITSHFTCIPTVKMLQKLLVQDSTCPAEATSPQTTFVPYLSSAWRPPTSSTVKVSTDRSTAVQWAHLCPQKWPTSTWKLLTFTGTVLSN